MLKDLTIGQYYPLPSLIHALDPRLKLVSLIAFIVIIFLVNSLAAAIFVSLIVLLIIKLSKVPFKMYLKNLKTILPIIILTSFLNIFYMSEGESIIKFWVINITVLGIRKALLMSFRIIMLIILSSVLTYTTTPTLLTDAIESLLSPLRYIGLGGAVHTIAMMMTISLRFIPTLVDETEKLMNAQKARGADFESGGIISRVKALIPILIPLLISSVRRAFELSEAMESRCYTGNTLRTRLKQLKFSHRDFMASAVIVLSIVATIILNNISIL